MIPEGITTSVFPRVARRLAAVGIGFDPWQQGLGQVALGCRADGKYAATIGGVVASIPRQVGKTYTFGNLLIGLCLEFPGYRAVWTSHHNRTTTNTFRSMQSMVRRKEVWPHIAVNGIRTANGEQEIRFANGSIIMFGAREQGFGRGMDAVDFLGFDEAQILGIKALEDMVPAANQAKHPHGGLVVFIGTPPRPSDDGEAFTFKRSKALAGKTSDQVYVEISADPDTDPDDQSKYGTFNPSYPHRTPLEAMLRMLENIPDEDSRRREMMGIWPNRAHRTPMPRWPELVAEGPPDDVRPDAYAVDRHQGLVSIAGVWVSEDSIHVEELKAVMSLDEAAEWLVQASRVQDPIMIDSMSGAAALIPMLKKRGRRKVRKTGPTDMVQACMVISDRVAEGTLTHSGQASLAEAIASADKRTVRSGGGWAWKRSGEADIAPLVAASLACLAAVTERMTGQKRERKTRRAVIG